MYHDYGTPPSLSVEDKNISFFYFAALYKYLITTRGIFATTYFREFRDLISESKKKVSRT